MAGCRLAVEESISLEHSITKAGNEVRVQFQLASEHRRGEQVVMV